MKTMPLGDSGVEVSAMCFGAMRCGTSSDWDSSVELLDTYVEAGGTFIDTANIYAHWLPGGKGGDSEELLGRWMRERGNREELFIATKVGFAYQDVPISLRAEIIEQECGKSLARMGIETIDLYYAHKDDEGTPLEETMRAFDRLVKAGKVRLIGGSNYTASRMADAAAVSEANDLAAYCCIQQRHTYLRPKCGAGFGLQTAADRDLLDYCKARNITPLAYSPLLGGAYTRDDKPLGSQYVGPDGDARMAALAEVADEKGATVNQVIFAWMMHGDPAVLPVFSASTPEQMREDLGALDVQLTPEDMARLDQAGA